MKTLPPHIARRLDLPAGAPLSRVYDAKRPPDPLQRGAMPALALEDIQPAHEVAEVRSAALPEGFGRVGANGRVLVFPTGTYTLLDPEAPHRVHGELLYVDTAGRDVWLACTGAPDGLLIHVSDGDLEALSPETPSLLEAMPLAEPAPSLGAPPIGSWIAEVWSPAWLGAATAALAASPDRVDRVAATGVVVRFWEAPDRAARRTALQQQRAWLEPAARDAVADVLLAADRLLDQLHALEELDDDAARVVARQAARERDRLESARAALTAARTPSSLDAALQATDRAARDDDRLASFLEEAPAFDEDYADAVREREPFAWWVDG